MITPARQFVGFILFFIAIALGVILFPVSFCIGIIILPANKYLFNIAYAIDLLGNVVCAPIFEVLFIKNTPNKYSFGDPIDTISYVIAFNKHIDNLTRTGKALAAILDFIDPGHTDLTIQNDIASSIYDSKD